MVGTSPMIRPRVRGNTRRLRISAMVRTIDVLIHGWLSTAGKRKLCSGSGNSPCSTSAIYCLRGGDHLVAQMRVLLDEFRRNLVVQSESIVAHQHLSVAVRTRADADGGDRKLRRNRRGHFRRDAFQHDGERARLFQRQRIFHQPVGLILRCAPPRDNHPIDGSPAGPGRYGPSLECQFQPAAARYRRRAVRPRSSPRKRRPPASSVPHCGSHRPRLACQLRNGMSATTNARSAPRDTARA